jgi:hypothetical protein
MQLVRKAQFREGRNLLILLNRRLPRWVASEVQLSHHSDCR